MQLTDFFNVNTILLLGTLGAALAYFFVFARRGASDASVESNDILRGLIDDQKQEILKLRDRQHEMTNEMQSIKLNLQHMSDKREYLEKLVMLALQQYFATDPEIAKAVNVSITTKTVADTKPPKL